MSQLALASDTSIAERPRSSEIIASASLVGNGGHASQSSCRSAIAYAGSKSGLNVERKSHRLKCRPRGLAVEREDYVWLRRTIRKKSNKIVGILCTALRIARKI